MWLHQGCWEEIVLGYAGWPQMQSHAYLEDMHVGEKTAREGNMKTEQRDEATSQGTLTAHGSGKRQEMSPPQSLQGASGPADTFILAQGNWLQAQASRSVRE